MHCPLCLQALLRRLEQRLSARGLVGNDSAQMLLRRIAPKNAPHGCPLERYPARVFLCAYMVQSHPQMVFSSVVGGSCEAFATDQQGVVCDTTCAAVMWKMGHALPLKLWAPCLYEPS